MNISLSRIRELVREQLFLLSTAESTEHPDSTDAWHPRDVVPLEDAWAGGDNVDSPVDHAHVETGESNSGNHTTTGFSGTPEPLGDGECGGQNFSPSSNSELQDIIDLIFLREADDIVDSPAPNPDGLVDITSEEGPEREDIVIRIIGDMEEAGLTGETGLMQHVDNVDEFEDLIRHIFQDVRLDNRQLASVAMSIAKDFLENPEDAASYSNYNLE